MKIILLGSAIVAAAAFAASVVPRNLQPGDSIVYVTRSGKVLDEESFKCRIEFGVPISIHFRGKGENRRVDSITIDED